MLGVWIGKLVARILKLAGRNATSLPGKLALRLSPRLLHRLGQQLERCIVVTGTNGKTTTNRLLAAMLGKDMDIVSNREGANMEQGLVAALLQRTSWFGRLQCKTAVLEVDEATLPLVARDLPIRVAVVTNVFRDQLDRYGELDSTLQKLLKGLAQTQATLVLNGDDPLARHIGLHYAGHSLYYGLAANEAQPLARQQTRDGAFCLDCGHRLEYDGFFYGQLGIYHCPNCDFYRPQPEFEGVLAGRDLVLRQATLPEQRFSLPVRGLFNIYNALGAIAAARVCGLETRTIAAGLADFTAPVGRMQPYPTSPETILNLIKNPTGCDGVLQSISAEPGGKILLIAINDLAADGRDVSWLWDADFELVPEEMNAVHVVLSGFRGEDMALRLKYAGYPAQHMTVQPELDAAVDAALDQARALGLTVHVLVTYTALYPMAGILKGRSRIRVENPAVRPSVS